MIQRVRRSSAHPLLAVAGIDECIDVNRARRFTGNAADKNRHGRFIPVSGKGGLANLSGIVGIRREWHVDQLAVFDRHTAGQARKDRDPSKVLCVIHGVASCLRGLRGDIGTSQAAAEGG
ncbi:hypothetical protein D3C80_1720940 [compost metagenome]